MKKKKLRMNADHSTSPPTSQPESPRVVAWASAPAATASADARYFAPLWSRHWERVIPFFAFPAEIRRIIYTTNAVESLNMSLRKIIKTRGAFPSEESAVETALPRLAERRRAMGNRPALEGRPEPVYSQMGG
jgi:transposase-like protein